VPVFFFTFHPVRSDPVDNYYQYLRTYSQELGSRIVEMYPPVQGPNDSIAKQVATLLRKPLPAQALTITRLAKHLKTARSVRIVGECGTGKILMSIGVAHTHADGAPYSAIAMCPPHLVLKWAREVLITVPRGRAFVIYDLRKGGDPPKLLADVLDQPAFLGIHDAFGELWCLGAALPGVCDLHRRVRRCGPSGVGLARCRDTRGGAASFCADAQA
jgi:hypothetical protein